MRISTFLSVLDVHITRSPVAGKIVRSVYVPGAFFNAALDKASEENERRAIIIEKPDGVEIAVVQIAGLIARRIVAFVHEGDSVGAGERIGLIRFGSRVDVYLPPGQTALVCVGQLANARRNGARRPQIDRAGAGGPAELIRKFDVFRG